MVINMRKRLEELYRRLLSACGVDQKADSNRIIRIIKQSLSGFVKSCLTPAIWCYGKHTKMLMADFIYEMKGVRYIIDATYSQEEATGFRIIRQENILPEHIDGIIISSFKYRDEIKQIIRDQYSDIKYLDLYEELEKNGVALNYEYYTHLHPYGHYCRINNFRLKLREAGSDQTEELYKALIAEFSVIKDFASALSCIRQVQMDGLRRQDILDDLMPEMRKWVRQNTMFYQNAYSVSTSTYESLIPAYEENDDLRTGYYERDVVMRGKCRFINEAVRQNRKIYFYTDSVAYIDSPDIMVKDQMQTATEKIWDFILDALDEDNGLFYIHLLYESHFSYPNPYTEEALISDGTSIFFDYLAINGGGLRTDYVKQHADALKYLDDVLMPFIKNIRCRMVIYADHGNVIFPKATRLSEIDRTKFSHHKDLTAVPFMIQSPEILSGETEEIESIMSINSVVISLMNHQPYFPEKRDFVKVLRSEIYNPDFQYLYRKCGFERELLAFEAFIFRNGSQFVVYSDGKCDFFTNDSCTQIDDISEKKAALEQIRDRITVCSTPFL